MEGGENSYFYIIKLSRRYGLNGLVQVNPKIVMLVPGWDPALLQAIGDDDISIEDSPAFDAPRGIVYFANSGGLVQGWDVSDLLGGGSVYRQVFRFWDGDDTDATIVIDPQGDLIVARHIEESFNRTRSGPTDRSIGSLMKLDPRNPGNPVVWSVRAGSDLPDGGMLARPAYDRGTIYALASCLPGRVPRVPANQQARAGRDADPRPGAHPADRERRAERDGRAGRVAAGGARGRGRAARGEPARCRGATAKPAREPAVRGAADRPGRAGPPVVCAHPPSGPLRRGPVDGVARAWHRSPRGRAACGARDRRIDQHRADLGSDLPVAPPPRTGDPEEELGGPLAEGGDRRCQEVGAASVQGVGLRAHPLRLLGVLHRARIDANVRERPLGGGREQVAGRRSVGGRGRQAGG